MPTPTYTALANTTLGSTATSVTFSSIPGTYRDLVVIFSGKSGTTTATDFRINVNNAGSSTQRVFLFGGGSTPGSGTDSNSDIGQLAASTANTTDMIIQIMDSSATDKHKTILTRESRNGVTTVVSTVTRWINTAAVTSIVFTVPSQSIGAGSTFALYGIVS